MKRSSAVRSVFALAGLALVLWWLPARAREENPWQAAARRARFEEAGLTSAQTAAIEAELFETKNEAIRFTTRFSLLVVVFWTAAVVPWRGHEPRPVDDGGSGPG